MQNLSNTTSFDGLENADAGPSTGQKPAFLERQNGSDSYVLGWPRLQPAGQRTDGKSASLTSLATDKSLQAGRLSTRSENGEQRYMAS